MMKSIKLFGLAVLIIPMLSSCAVIEPTLDCADLWRFDNCILIDGVDK